MSSDGAVVVLRPAFLAAQIAPSPASINTPFSIAISVIEQSVTLEPVWFHAAEIYAGEA